MEAAYLFGGGVALLACFQPFQDFRAYNARIEGDYEPGGKFTAADAALRITHAEEFIALAEAKLGALPSTASATADEATGDNA